MSIAETLSNKLTGFITKYSKLPIDVEKREEINYGILTLIMNSYKLIIILIVAYFLGILNEIVYMMISFGTLRAFAGGIHLKNGISCLITTSIIYFGIVYGAIYIPLNKYLINIIFFISLILIYNYAPSDTEEKPLLSKSLRQNLKALSLGVLTIMYFISIKYSLTTLGAIVTFSALAESLLITPIVYKLWGRRYRNYGYYP